MYGKLPDKKNLLQHKLKVRSHITLVFLPLISELPTPHEQTQSNKLPLQGQERKYFDSGDYAMSKAGKASDAGLTNIGSEHPSPDTIPHLSSSSPHNGPNGTNNGLSLQPTPSSSQTGGAGAGLSGSPVKESSFLQRGMSIDDQGGAGGRDADDEIEKVAGEMSPPPQGVEGVPIRQ